MSVEPENEEHNASLDLQKLCGACGNVISSKALYVKINCGHGFHKSCLAKAEKLRPYCPLCNCRLHADPSTPSTSGATTRSQAKMAASQSSNAGASETQPKSVLAPNAGGSNSFSIRPCELQEMISSMMATQQAQLLASLSEEVSRLVQSNVESRFSRMSSNSQSTSPLAAQQPQNPTSPRQMHTLPAVEERTFREMFGISLSNSQSQHQAPLNVSRSGQSASNNSSSSDLNSRPDKILHIVSNWRIIFTGSSQGISVENFIYRIEALTSQSLHGDFDLLCRNVSSLFEGKAADWFWRYHRFVPAGMIYVELSDSNMATSDLKMMI